MTSSQALSQRNNLDHDMKHLNNRTRKNKSPKKLATNSSQALGVSLATVVVAVRVADASIRR